MGILKSEILFPFPIDKLVEDGILITMRQGSTGKGHMTIKRSAFPLAYAAVRNFLISAGVLDKEENGEICVSGSYENDWTAKLHTRRRKFTLEQLRKQQEEQSKRGLEAEEFALKLEKLRLPSKAMKIKTNFLILMYQRDMISFSY